MEYGTEVEVAKVVESYSSGARDVLCRGLRVFRIKKIRTREEGKQYGGWTVEFLDNLEDGVQIQREQLTALIFESYLHLEIPPPNIKADTIESYTRAHKMGLSLQQEYTLLKLASEKERLTFLINSSYHCHSSFSGNEQDKDGYRNELSLQEF